MWEKLKEGVSVIAGLGLLVLILGLVVVFIEGGAWLGAKIYPWLVLLSLLALAIVIFVLLPLSLFKRTRGAAAVGLLYTSFVFGTTLWVWGLILTYNIWGFWAVLLGLFLFAIGVVPIAMLATLFEGMWPQLIELVVLTVLVFGVRLYSMYLINKLDREAVPEIA